MSTNFTNSVVRHNDTPGVVGHRVYELDRPIPYMREDGRNGLCSVGETRHVVACDPTDGLAEAYGFDYTILFPCTGHGEVLGAELAESHESFDDVELFASLGINGDTGAVRIPVARAIDRRCARLDAAIAAQFALASL